MPLKDSYSATPIPGILRIIADRPHIPSFPLARSFAPTSASKDDNVRDFISIEYRVSRDTGNTLHKREKTNTRLGDSSIHQITPIGRFGHLASRIDRTENGFCLTVNPTYHRLGRVSVGNVHSAGRLLRDLTNIALLLNGYCLVHAAAVQLSRRTALLIGLSNTGKTSTVRCLVKDHGARFLGDDLVATDGERVFACPHTSANFQPESGVTLKHRVVFGIRTGIPFAETFFPMPHSLGEALGFESLVDQASATDILFLRKGSSDQHTHESVDAPTAKQLFLASNRTEFTFYSCPQLFAGEYLGVPIGANAAITLEEEIAGKLSRNCKCALVTGDRAYFIEETIRTLTDE